MTSVSTQAQPMTARQRWAAYLPQIGIALDQLANAAIPPFFTLSYADETLSARTWRAAKRGKLVGRLARPAIDLLFIWQKDEAGNRWRFGHCERAFVNEMRRRGLPPEYRAGSDTTQ